MAVPCNITKVRGIWLSRFRRGRISRALCRPAPTSAGSREGFCLLNTKDTRSPSASHPNRSPLERWRASPTPFGIGLEDSSKSNSRLVLVFLDCQSRNPLLTRKPQVADLLTRGLLGGRRKTNTKRELDLLKARKPIPIGSWHKKRGWLAAFASRPRSAKRLCCRPQVWPPAPAAI